MYSRDVGIAQLLVIFSAITIPLSPKLQPLLSFSSLRNFLTVLLNIGHQPNPQLPGNLDFGLDCLCHLNLHFLSYLKLGSLTILLPFSFRTISTFWVLKASLCIF